MNQISQKDFIIIYDYIIFTIVRMSVAGRLEGYHTLKDQIPTEYGTPHLRVDGVEVQVVECLELKSPWGWLLFQ